VNCLHFLQLHGFAKLLFDKLVFPLRAKLNENYSNAEQLFKNACDLSDEIGDKNAKSWVSHHLAWVLINKGQASLAEDYALEALETYKVVQDQRGISDCHEQLGRIYLAMDNQNSEKIAFHFQQSLDIRNEIQNFHGAASSILNFAFLYWHTRQYLKSFNYLLKGMKKYREMGLLNSKRFLTIIILFSVWTVGKQDWTL
jgi:tetratricopeptide (TPR) repeat protein